jgi:type I restriction enzyme S subunit
MMVNSAITCSETAGYKQTSIGLIPKDWEVKKLGEIGTFSKGKGILKNDVIESGFPCIRYGEIYTTHNYIIKNFKSFINETIANESQEIFKGDILFAGSGETIEDIGKCVAYMGEERAYAGGDIIIFKPHSDFSEAISYTLETDIAKRQKRFMGQGNSIVHLYSSDLQKLKIPIPPLPEQQKIAEILSTFDEAINVTKQIIEELKVRNKGLMQKVFNGNYKHKKLSEIFERVTTKNTEQNQNVITISAQRGFVIQTDFFKKVIASDVLDHYFLVKKGDFCYNKSYSNGYPWGATKRLNNLDKAVVTTLYICFRIKDDFQNSGNFFEYFFEYGILNQGLSKVANEGGRAHGLLNVTATDFFNIKIAVPSFEEQTRIATILNTATNELKQYEQKLQNLQLQKKGLMQQLLTGKTRVKI